MAALSSSKTGKGGKGGKGAETLGKPKPDGMEYPDGRPKAKTAMSETL
jgi:hypothetical protein